MPGLEKRKDGAKHLRGLTDQQAAFVREYVAVGGNGSKAAGLAGYGDTGARAWELLQQPAILAAIRVEQMRVIGTEGASTAIGTLLAVARDTTAKGSERVAASRALLEAASLIGKTAEKALDDKPLAEMTLDELQRFIAAERVALATMEQALPRTIEHQPAPVAPSVAPDARVIEGESAEVIEG